MTLITKNDTQNDTQNERALLWEKLSEMLTTSVEGGKLAAIIFRQERAKANSDPAVIQDALKLHTAYTDLFSHIREEIIFPDEDC